MYKRAGGTDARRSMRDGSVISLVPVTSAASLWGPIWPARGEGWAGGSFELIKVTC